MDFFATTDFRGDLKEVTVSGAPHGLNVPHAQAFNEALLSFLRV